MIETILLICILILLSYLILSRKRGQPTNQATENIELEILKNENRELKTEQKSQTQQRDELIRHQSMNELSQKEIIELKDENQRLKEMILQKEERITENKVSISKWQSSHEQLKIENAYIKSKEIDLTQQLKAREETLNEKYITISNLELENKNMHQKVVQERESIVETKQQLQKEFELLANRILENNTQRFANNNKASMDAILKPLQENIALFKGKVEEVYDKESKQRFSLEQEVKKLMELNHRISADAQSLTHALKGESKVQGNWGEMILESILEKSGLRKGEEYFMEHVLRDQEGKRLRNEHGNTMRPDAVIVYPDNRQVIVDAKVSLNAYIRYCETTDPEQQELELKSHVDAIKKHVVTLSNKSYDDYPEALDFTMMFIPNEPAYMAAMKHEPQLWQYAYEKRILILSPTNLITALKLVSDLWKREHQNLNALEIAERGGKLYDKFVGFIENLQKVDKNLSQAQGSFQEAFKQLHTGKDNLVRQTQRLKDLGVKSKKRIPEQYLSESDTPEIE
ncbi:DNA recombination protein RmuC [Halosquirtibacter laminarini]|uniref:DNA recombination protein RmuC n=1 Tax=Halosquirtibacter laminarini TaxID=3374600 RepID=A0AC61NBH7_9BACT|nr:DNA recombination protein RmuC [Prolixibacteraceae bacterium]